jgi:hypothetical protein
MMNNVFGMAIEPVEVDHNLQYGDIIIVEFKDGFWERLMYTTGGQLLNLEFGTFAIVEDILHSGHWRIVEHYRNATIHLVGGRIK